MTTRPGIDMPPMRLIFPTDPEERAHTLDNSRAQWALYSLLTGHPEHAQDHLAHIRPHYLATVSTTLYQLADMITDTPGEPQ